MKISDVADIINVSEKDPANSGIDIFVGLEHYDIAEPVIKRFGSTKMLSTAAKKFEAGDVLIARRNVYLQRASLVNFSGLTSGDSIILRVKKDLSIEETDYQTMCQLLPFVLNSINFWDYANTNADGTMSKRLSPAMLQEYEFDLPPLAEQKVLAEKLWAAYEVKQSYLKMIAATEEMVKSQFIEMFAPFENKPEFNHTLQYLIDNDFITYHLDGNHGGDYPRADEFVDEGVPYLSANCINNSQIDWDKAKYLSQQRACKLKKGLAKNGDVLFAHNATVGPTAILRSSLPLVVLGTSLTAYRCNGSKILPEYLFGYMRSLFFCNQYLYGMQQTTRNQVPITAQRKFIFIVPPIEKQITYSDFYNQADKSISELRKSVDAIDKVIKSLINENL